MMKLTNASDDLSRQLSLNAAVTPCQAVGSCPTYRLTTLLHHLLHVLTTRERYRFVTLRFDVPHGHLPAYYTPHTHTLPILPTRHIPHGTRATFASSIGGSGYR